MKTINKTNKPGQRTGRESGGNKPQPKPIKPSNKPKIGKK